LTFLNSFNPNQGGGSSAGEIIAFDNINDRLFVTSSNTTLTGANNVRAISGGVHQVNIFGITNTGSKTDLGVVDYSDTFGLAANMRGLSSVAVNTAKGLGVVSLIPTNNATILGKVGFFNTATGAKLGTLDVGFHPDSVTFSPDGTKLIVVNEGEFNPNVSASDLPYFGTNPSNVNAPGSISIIDVSSITLGNYSGVGSLTAVTKDFSVGNLDTGVSIATLRNSNLAVVGTSGALNSTVPAFNTADIGAIEPEYASVVGDKVYVSLQDNNAIAEYDLVSGLWTEVKNLGTIAVTIDATDRPAASPPTNISITQVVKGLPMPDTIGTYVIGGKTYVVSANEGDARLDDRDQSRFGVTGISGILDSSLPAAGVGIRADTAFGRLQVSRLDGDTDGDGDIDEAVIFGTRSYSIYEKTATGLDRVYDSGSFFETWIRDNDALNWQDGRSPNKGPEPEGLAIGEINGRTYLFIGMERTGHIFQFDITNPLGVTFVDAELIPFATAQRPEGFQFISAADSPTGQALLVVGYEGNGGGTPAEQIGIFTVIPEPSSFAIIAACASLGFVALRRRRVA